MNQGLSREEAEKEAKQALTQVGVKESNFKKSPFELSGGQKKRVAIAGVLAMNPKILILDEPTAGLDPKGRDDILDQIAELHKVRGITIVLVSHSMEDIAKYVERLIVMNHGEAVFDDEPKKVFSHYKELETMGLAAPQITYIMHALKEHGLHVDADATTVEEHRDQKSQSSQKFGPWVQSVKNGFGRIILADSNISDHFSAPPFFSNGESAAFSATRMLFLASSTVVASASTFIPCSFRACMI